MLTKNRVSGGELHVGDCLVSFWPFVGLAVTHIRYLLWRVGTDDSEISARAQVHVSRARREHDDVTGPERDLASVGPTKLDLCRAARAAEDFVGRGVVMLEIENAVSPCVFPAVRYELFLDACSRIMTAYCNRIAVEYDRECVVREGAVVLEHE